MLLPWPSKSAAQPQIGQRKVRRGDKVYEMNVSPKKAADDTAKTETPDVTLRMTNFPPGTVRHGDEHQVDLSAVSHHFYESYVLNHGAHRANEHHGQRLLTEEREIA